VSEFFKILLDFLKEKYWKKIRPCFVLVGETAIHLPDPEKFQHNRYDNYYSNDVKDIHIGTVQPI